MLADHRKRKLGFGAWNQTHMFVPRVHAPQDTQLHRKRQIECCSGGQTKDREESGVVDAVRIPTAFSAEPLVLKCIWPVSLSSLL